MRYNAVRLEEYELNSKNECGITQKNWKRN